MTSVSPAPTTMLVPDFPFSYDGWLRHPAGLGCLPRSAPVRRWPWSAVEWRG